MRSVNDLLQFRYTSGYFRVVVATPGTPSFASPGSLGGNGMCVGGELRGWWTMFLLSQLSSDFTGIRILFVILRVVDVMRMAEQARHIFSRRNHGRRKRGGRGGLSRPTFCDEDCEY